MQQPPDSTGIPVIDAAYGQTEGRWNRVEGGSVLMGPMLLTGGVLGIVIYLIVLWKRRKKAIAA